MKIARTEIKVGTRRRYEQALSLYKENGANISEVRPWYKGMSYLVCDEDKWVEDVGRGYTPRHLPGRRSWWGSDEHRYKLIKLPIGAQWEPAIASIPTQLKEQFIAWSEKHGNQKQG